MALPQKIALPSPCASGNPQQCAGSRRASPQIPSWILSADATHALTHSPPSRVKKRGTGELLPSSCEQVPSQYARGVQRRRPQLQPAPTPDEGERESEEKNQEKGERERGRSRAETKTDTDRDRDRETETKTESGTEAKTETGEQQGQRQKRPSLRAPRRRWSSGAW